MNIAPKAIEQRTRQWVIGLLGLASGMATALLLNLH
jgi:hypothetical protein